MDTLCEFPHFFERLSHANFAQKLKPSALGIRNQWIGSISGPTAYVQQLLADLIKESLPVILGRESRRKPER